MSLWNKATKLSPFSFISLWTIKKSSFCYEYFYGKYFSEIVPESLDSLNYETEEYIWMMFNSWVHSY